MTIASITLPIHSIRVSRNTPKPATACMCVRCITIPLNPKGNTHMETTTKWIAGTIVSPNDAVAAMFKQRPENGPADGGDGDDNSGFDNDGSADDDSDETSNLVAEAAHHLDSIQDFNAPDDVDGHIAAARDCLSRHLQKIGAEKADDDSGDDAEQPPVRTQLSNSLHTIEFPQSRVRP
jgi:hypothetical protein